MSKSRNQNQSKRATQLFKKHETAYRALINLLIRQVERELREEDAQQAETNQHPPQERKDGA